LRHLLAAIEQHGLACDLVLDGIAHVLERVDILELGFRA